MNSSHLTEIEEKKEASKENKKEEERELFAMAAASSDLSSPVAVAVALVAVLVALALALLQRAARRKPFLDANEWKPLRLAERKDLTHNTRLFR